MKKKIVLSCLAIALFIGGSVYYKERTQYEHQFAVCAIFKDEAPHLKEWIDYHHHILGATKFYLYNNESQDNYQTVLAPYIEQGLVELTDWDNSEEHALRGWLPKGASHNDYQIGANNHCIRHKALGKVRWIAMIDPDEFIVPTNGAASFKKLLAKRDNPWPLRTTGAYEIHWKVFGTSHLWELKENELQVEHLTLRSFDDHGWNRRQVKSIYRPEAVDVCLIHKAGKLFGRYNRKKELSTKQFNLNHYWLGTQSKLIKKRNITQDELSSFEAPFNQVDDRIIHQYLPELKEKTGS